MSKEQCLDCEYVENCFYLLKVKQSLSKEPCGQFRKKRVVKVFPNKQLPPKGAMPNARPGTDNTVA
jgi:hypothetical protein